jgi:hypothetical protein
MTTIIAALSAFFAEHWLVIVGAVGVVGGWLWICRELCIGAQPERDADKRGPEPPRWQWWAPDRRSRRALSSRRQTRHTRPHASFYTRRS